MASELVLEVQNESESIEMLCFQSTIAQNSAKTRFETPEPIYYGAQGTASRRPGRDSDKIAGYTTSGGYSWIRGYTSNA